MTIGNAGIPRDVTGVRLLDIGSHPCLPRLFAPDEVRCRNGISVSSPLAGGSAIGRARGALHVAVGCRWFRFWRNFRRSIVFAVLKVNRHHCAAYTDVQVLSALCTMECDGAPSHVRGVPF
jgi:hypothetical protein